MVDLVGVELFRFTLRSMDKKLYTNENLFKGGLHNRKSPTGNWKKRKTTIVSGLRKAVGKQSARMPLTFQKSLDFDSAYPGHSVVWELSYEMQVLQLPTTPL